MLKKMNFEKPQFWISAKQANSHLGALVVPAPIVPVNEKLLSRHK